MQSLGDLSYYLFTLGPSALRWHNLFVSTKNRDKYCLSGLGSAPSNYGPANNKNNNNNNNNNINLFKNNTQTAVMNITDKRIVRKK